MGTITIGNRSDLTPGMVELMHAIRYEVFVQRLGWALPLIDDSERDQYDTHEAVYFVACDGSGGVTACARVLPTTGSYMLPEQFPELLGDNPAPRSIDVWELSRFAISVHEKREGRIVAPSDAAVGLLHSVLEYARVHGIRCLVLVTSIAIERLLMKTGAEIHRFAAPARINGALCVSVYIEVPSVPRDVAIN